MAQNTFALMTNLGRAKEAAAIANGTAVVITHIAIGDGTTVPSGGETTLYHEVARKAISGHGTVVGASNVAYFDIFLEASEGPYTIREAGLIDQDGDLIAIARYDPPISKPIPSSGQTVEGTIRLEVGFSNIANINIVVDPSFKIELQRLTHLPWTPVISMTEAAPPATPSIGDVYVVPIGATGAWSGQAGKIAEYTSAGWGVIVPPDGHGIGLPDGRIFERINGAYVELVATTARRGLVRLASDPYDFANNQDPITPADFRTLSRGVGLDNLFLNSYFAWTNRFPTTSRINFNWANNTYWPDRWKNVTGSAITATIDHTTGGLAIPNGAKIRHVVERANIAPGDIVISAQVAQGALSCTIEASGMTAATVPLDKTDAAGRKYGTYTFPTVVGEDVSFTFLAIGDVRLSRTKLERGKKPSIWDPVSPDLELPRLNRYYQRHRVRHTWTAQAASEYFTMQITPRPQMRIAPEVAWKFDNIVNATNLTAGLVHPDGLQIFWQAGAAGSTVLEGDITLDADF
ncbi:MULTISPECIES: phage tail protein [unclassified Brucella]|uniref:phage tail-collar fiber domain-containing protein n=1 Tax=unclassified Brucella TaxID=2632610 RepID=UPI00217D1A96|nr:MULTISPECIES: phage tail protein [unclassified Brucella]UWF67371.1 phage tail protein [Brucella sp. 1315]UWF70496.1 phage tail protein [Brucella sp. 2594]